MSIRDDDDDEEEELLDGRALSAASFFNISMTACISMSSSVNFVCCSFDMEEEDDEEEPEESKDKDDESADDVDGRLEEEEAGVDVEEDDKFDCTMSIVISMESASLGCLADVWFGDDSVRARFAE